MKDEESNRKAVHNENPENDSIYQEIQIMLQEWQKIKKIKVAFHEKRKNILFLELEKVSSAKKR
jgi:hypothetical protein